MFTKYRVLTIVQDPQLTDALKQAAEVWPELGDEELIVELTLQGAAALSITNDPDDWLSKFFPNPLTRPKPKSLKEFLRKHPRQPADPEDPYALTRALEEQREERFP